MPIPTQSIIFYVFSVLMLFAGSMVVISRHTVRAALYLVVVFIAAAVLWMLLQAEFLSLVIIVIYVGAVMTLFLFVVMMMQLDVTPLQEGFVKYFPIALVLVGFIGYKLLHLLGPHFFGLSTYPIPRPLPADYSNTEAIGSLLYTHFIYAFEVAGVILLVAIISAITLAFRGPRNRLTQNIDQQIKVKSAERFRIVKMKSETNHRQDGKDST